MALYLIPREGLCEQVSSIVDTSHFLKVRVTLGCFLLARSLYIDMSPIVSADALTKPYSSASAELSATTACVLHHILMR